MNIFKNIFPEKKLSHPLSLSSLFADMHSHFIPGIDDGAKTLDDSIELIRGMNGMGFGKIITTPHIQGDFFTNTPEIILNGLAHVRAGVKKAGIPIVIDAAAEYLLDDRFEEKLKSNNLLTFGDKYILVELSFFSPNPNLYNLIFNLQIEGYKVILAHVERYSYWFNDFKKFEELKDRGVFFQVNTISLGGYYSAMVKKMAEKFIDLDMVDFLGSDMHNENYLHALENARTEKYLEKVLASGKLLNSKL